MNPSNAPVYIISGGMGALGEQLVRSTLAQFHGVDVPIKIYARVHHMNQAKTAVDEAAATGGTIVHTLVNAEIRQAVIEMAQEKQLAAIDGIGPFLDHMSTVLNQEPSGKPGLYRQLHETYFKRITAIEFTMAHDDGVNYNRWHQADIVLTGVSRVGKTPISIYLSMLGWKVANIPLIANIPPHEALFQLDRRRVVGLVIDPNQLLQHRKHRQSSLGVKGRSPYVDPTKIYRELEAARKIFRRGGFRTIDVSNKPIETSADQIVELVSRRLKSE